LLLLTSLTLSGFITDEWLIMPSQNRLFCWMQEVSLIENLHG